MEIKDLNEIVDAVKDIMKDLDGEGLMDMAKKVLDKDELEAFEKELKEFKKNYTDKALNATKKATDMVEKFNHPDVGTKISIEVMANEGDDKNIADTCNQVIANGTFPELLKMLVMGIQAVGDKCAGVETKRDLENYLELLNGLVRDNFENRDSQIVKDANK